MFSKKTVCFVTGASRGLGESIARNFAFKLPNGSALVLLARSQNDLAAVQKSLEKKSTGVTTIVQCFDQGKLDQDNFEAVFSHSFKNLGAKATDFQQAIFVHNAATIQPTKFIRNLPCSQEVTKYMNVNLSGVVALTTEFLEFFRASSDFGRVVINISSPSAFQPFKCWALYASGKAARDMFFKVLSAEEKDVRVLSYAPGALATDMFHEAMNLSEDPGMRGWLTETKTKLLTCDESVAKLIQVLENNAFESGAHVDVADDI